MKKKILLILTLILLFFISCLKVEAADVELTNYEVVNSEASVNASAYTYNEQLIINAGFRYTGENSTYKVTLKNSSENFYKINFENNSNEYVTYVYEMDDDIIYPNSTKDILITITYIKLFPNSEITTEENFYSNSDIVFSFVKTEDPSLSNPIEKSKTINISIEQDITSIFEDIDSIEGIEFEIADPSVIKIENGVIKPLSVGKTDISFKVLGVSYVLHITVTEEDLINAINPKTGDIVISFLIILFVSFVIIIAIRHHKIGKYIYLLLTLLVVIANLFPCVVYAEDTEETIKISFHVRILPQRYRIQYEYRYSSHIRDDYYNMEDGLTVGDVYNSDESYKKSSYIYFYDKDHNKTIITEDAENADLSDVLILDETHGYYYFYDMTCLAGDSLVIVYDKKKKKKHKKKLKDVTYDDLILCWDFDKAEFTYAKPLWIKQSEKVDSYYLLTFADGNTIKVIGDHKLFCVNKNRFVNAGQDDELKIGDTIYNSEGKEIKLVSKELIVKEETSCNIILDYHINLFVNDILTSCIFSNIYKIKDMKYLIDKNNRIDVSKLNVANEFIKGVRLKEVPKDFRNTETETIEYINKYFEDKNI